MWFYPIDVIATLAHWKLVFLSKGWCPANVLPYGNPPGFGNPLGEYVQCDQWHRFAVQRIDQLHPDLVIVTQEVSLKPNGDAYTAEQWGRGMTKTLQQLAVPARRIVVLGNIPTISTNPPLCLSRNTTNVQACSSPIPGYLAANNTAEERAANGVGARYLSVTPWFCAATCAAVIGRYEVYFDGYHITRAYAEYLTRVLDSALALSRYA
jgi:hypothetical protein